METSLSMLLEQLSVLGFWETRAFLYMDIIVTYLALLPILTAVSILLAVKDMLKLHQYTQLLFFLLTLGSLAFFAFFVHYKEGLESILEASSVGYNEAFIVIVLHAVISILTVVLWMFALLHAVSDYKRKALPGVYSESHKKRGKQVYLGITFTSLSAMATYWVLFVS